MFFQKSSPASAHEGSCSLCRGVTRLQRSTQRNRSCPRLSSRRARTIASNTANQRGAPIIVEAPRRSGSYYLAGCLFPFCSTGCVSLAPRWRFRRRPQLCLVVPHRRGQFRGVRSPPQLRLLEFLAAVERHAGIVARSGVLKSASATLELGANRPERFSRSPHSRPAPPPAQMTAASRDRARLSGERQRISRCPCLSRERPTAGDNDPLPFRKVRRNSSRRNTRGRRAFRP